MSRNFGAGVFVIILALWLGYATAPTRALLPSPTAVPKPAMAATTIPVSTATTTTSAAPAASKDVCLGCHGPFEKRVGSPANYVAPSGETTSPHRYVPHDSKAAIAIPECTNCHEPHPVPPTSPMVVPKADVQWCYGACHHTNTLEPCKKCH